jgi:hypothetical protein
MNSNLIGQYQIDKSNLIGINAHLVIGSRKHPTANKPKNYLLLKISPTQYKFISSLYPIQPIEANRYTFDHSGINYILELNREQNRAIIQPYKGGGSVSK